MSHTFSDKNFKVHYQEYLIYKNEPKETRYDGAEAEIDIGLIKSSYYGRRRLRRVAERLRQYSP